jgi:hypothetical protein
MNSAPRAWPCWSAAGPGDAIRRPMAAGRSVCASCTRPRHGEPGVGAQGRPAAASKRPPG